MTKKLITRSHFAKLCGVTPSSVTQVADTLLKAAKIGKHIDLNHPAAREYLERQTRESPDALGPAIDPYYTDAVEFCQKPAATASAQYSGNSVSGTTAPAQLWTL